MTALWLGGMIMPCTELATVMAALKSPP